MHISDDRECNSNAENASPEGRKSYKIISNLNVYICRYSGKHTQKHANHLSSIVQAKQFECVAWGKDI